MIQSILIWLCIHKDRIKLYINARLINRNVNYTIDLNDNHKVDMFKGSVITRASSHLTSIGMLNNLNFVV